MKVLVIGNYANSRQESMQRLGEMMRDGLSAAGHEVRLVCPSVCFGRLWPNEVGVGKWLGYLDRFVLYPAVLRRQARWADMVHVCDQANAVYIPHLRGKAHVITCNDLLAIRAALGEIPESPTGWTGRIFQAWILRNLRKARTVACISKQTEKEVQRLVALPPESVTVVPLALNYPYEPMSVDQAAPHLRRLGVSVARPFLLHVGGNQWYKNRPGVVRMFAELVKRPAFADHVLLLAGKPWSAELRDLVGAINLEDRVVELVEVSNQQLCALYSTAEALLFPSLEEGFGWPILEAQASGCPVVTTNRPPMTDVSGGAAILIDPCDPKAAAAEVVRRWQAREEIRERGLANASAYSLREMIAEYLRTYAAVSAQAVVRSES